MNDAEIDKLFTISPDRIKEYYDKQQQATRNSTVEYNSVSIATEIPDYIELSRGKYHRA